MNGAPRTIVPIKMAPFGEGMIDCNGQVDSLPVQKQPVAEFGFWFARRNDDVDFTMIKQCEKLASVEFLYRDLNFGEIGQKHNKEVSKDTNGKGSNQTDA